MFIAHQGVALAAKAAAPRVSLGPLFVAAMWLDLVWPIFLLVGIEEVAIRPGDTAVTPLAFVSYPYSHSLLFVALWAVLLAVLYGLVTRYWRAAALIALLVLSHWVLDLIVHRPDLPLYPDGPVVGLGLWNSPAGTLIAEFGLLALGVALYVRATRPADRIGRWGFWALIAFLALLYLANFAGPPPPSWQAVAWVGLASWLLPLWAWWADGHRRPR